MSWRGRRARPSCRGMEAMAAFACWRRRHDNGESLAGCGDAGRLAARGARGLGRARATTRRGRPAAPGLRRRLCLVRGARRRRASSSATPPRAPPRWLGGRRPVCQLRPPAPRPRRASRGAARHAAARRRRDRARLRVRRAALHALRGPRRWRRACLCVPRAHGRRRRRTITRRRRRRRDTAMGPFLAHGGNDWTELDCPHMAARRTSPPTCAAWRCGALDSAGRLVGLPPLHLHHTQIRPWAPPRRRRPARRQPLRMGARMTSAPTACASRTPRTCASRWPSTTCGPSGAPPRLLGRGRHLGLARRAARGVAPRRPRDGQPRATRPHRRARRRGLLLLLHRRHAARGTLWLEGDVQRFHAHQRYFQRAFLLVGDARAPRGCSPTRTAARAPALAHPSMRTRRSRAG